MNVMRKRTSGMTLIEMMAAITVLMILTAILAEVFFQATQATAKGKGLAEIYQVARALKSLLAKDISGATPDCLTSAENGLTLSPAYGLPPGPYNEPQYQTGVLSDADLRRMLMGGSDYLVLTSSNASSADKAVAKVYYVLRASGEFIRVVNADTVFAIMDYRYDAIEEGVDVDDPFEMEAYEEQHVIAENVRRVKFSFFDRGRGPISETAAANANGNWVDSWDWVAKPYLPMAVKVEIQLVDGLWKTTDDDAVSNRFFDATKMDKDLDGTPGLDQAEAGELFDADDGEAFSFIVDIPLGMRSSGG